MNKYLLLAVLVVALFVVGSASFVVDETEQVVITQFGKPVGDAIMEPGIHFKVPIIQAAHFFDKRFLEWDGDPNQVPTRDKRFVWVDTYARWRIKDPLLFFQRLQNERRAQSRLDDILDGETRNAIANSDLVEIIRSTNQKFVDPSVAEEAQKVADGEAADTDKTQNLALVDIKIGREKITRAIIAKTAPRTLEMGIELLDLRFKRINYVDEVRKKIFERMISERRRIADKFRSEGQGESSKILGDKERELQKIESEAKRLAVEIEGTADAEATAIYASAYNRNGTARELYRFLRTMETYRNTFSEKDILIMSTKGDFYRYLQKQSGR